MATKEAPNKAMTLWVNDSDCSKRLVRSLERNGWSVQLKPTTSSSPYAEVRKRMFFGFRQIGTLTIRF